MAGKPNHTVGLSLINLSLDFCLEGLCTLASLLEEYREVAGNLRIVVRQAQSLHLRQSGSGQLLAWGSF